MTGELFTVRNSDRRNGVKLTVLIRVGIIFCGAGAVAAAMGVSILFHAAKGGLGLAIFLMATALLGFFIAGCMFWGYRYLKKRPELGSQQGPSGSHTAGNQR